MKFKRRYEEKYRKGVFVHKHLLPKRLPHLRDNVKIVAIELKAAGIGDSEFGRTEYQDVRVYVTTPEADDE